MARIKVFRDLKKFLVLIIVLVVLISCGRNDTDPDSTNSGFGCGSCDCGNCGCGNCGDCGCGNTEDTDADGDETGEDNPSNEGQQPVQPSSICGGSTSGADVTISGTKTVGTQYKTYSYTYDIKSCSGTLAYEIYLKGANRLSTESGNVAKDKSRSGSNTVTSSQDFSIVCVYTVANGEECSNLS